MHTFPPNALDTIVDVQCLSFVPTILLVSLSFLFVFALESYPWVIISTWVRTSVADASTRSLFITGDRAATARALLEASPDPSADAVAALELRRAELQAERLRVRKELRNENRKRKRLLAKAKGLSDDELVQVLVIKAQAKGKAKAKARASTE